MSFFSTYVVIGYSSDCGLRGRFNFFVTAIKILAGPGLKYAPIVFEMSQNAEPEKHDTSMAACQRKTKYK